MCIVKQTNLLSKILMEIKYGKNVEYVHKIYLFFELVTEGEWRFHGEKFHDFYSSQYFSVIK